MNQDLHIRLANPNDIAFIYATWLNNYHYDSALGKECKDSIFFREYREVIDHILGSNDTKVAVASLQNDEATIFGYMVYESGPTPCIHYVFIKENFRELGIAKQLFKFFSTNQSIKHIYSHKTSYVADILKKYPQLTYNPFILFTKGVPNG